MTSPACQSSCSHPCIVLDSCAEHSLDCAYQNPVSTYLAQVAASVPTFLCEKEISCPSLVSARVQPIPISCSESQHLSSDRGHTAMSFEGTLRLHHFDKHARPAASQRTPTIWLTRRPCSYRSRLQDGIQIRHAHNRIRAHVSVPARHVEARPRPQRRRRHA